MAPEGSGVRLLVLVGVVAICAGCAAQEHQSAPSSSGPPETSLAPLPILPEDAIDGMQADSSTPGIEAISDEALDPVVLASVLASAGFDSARERRFSGRTAGLSSVVARVVAFDSAAGAEAYVDWITAHGADLIGTVRTERPLDLPGSPFVSAHTPDGCCPKEQPIFLAAWPRGRLVLYLKAIGPGVERTHVEELAHQMDLVVTRDT